MVSDLCVDLCLVRSLLSVDHLPGLQERRSGNLGIGDGGFFSGPLEVLVTEFDTASNVLCPR